ncbi:MAG: hypothetical protein V1729_02125 [Candidatus Woesearchaeota archaeon]
MKKGLSLISSGIDSPVATWMIIEKGIEVIAVHFSNEPLSFASPREKAIELSQRLGVKKIFIVKHGSLVQVELMRNCDNKARCVLCRRMMFRIAEKIAKQEGCDFLLTGENLAQVASQTLENMAVTDSAIRMPIIRPLLCNDKQETIDLAKKIGTYQMSIEAASCCNAVPKNPVTKSIRRKMEAEESRIDVERIVGEAVATAEVIEL